MNNEVELPYDETDPQDIENYAKKLIGKTFYDVLREYFKDNELELEKTLNKNKGKLGNLIEEYYFYYKPNSNPNPDFLKANTELKVTPYIKNKNGELKAKERLVIGMIPNNEPIENLKLPVPSNERTILDIVIKTMAHQSLSVTLSLNTKSAMIAVATISKFPSNEALDAEPVFIPIIKKIGARISKTIIPTVYKRFSFVSLSNLSSDLA